MALLCPHCNGWRYSPSDRFCGHCGELLILAHAEIRPRKLYLGRPVPSVVEVVLSNRSGNLGGTRFLLRDARGELPEVLVLALRDDELTNQGEQQPVKVESDRLGLFDGRQREWHLIHEIDAGKCFPIGRIDSLLAPPELTIDRAELLLDPADPFELVLTLRHVKGGAVDIESLGIAALAAKDLPLPHLSPDRPLPLTLAPTETLTLHILVPDALRNLLRLQPTGIQLALELVSADLGEVATLLPFRLRIPMPAQPALELTDPQHTGVSGRPFDLGLTLANLGGAPCRALQTQVLLLRAGAAPSVHEIPVERNGIELSPGERKTRRLAIPLTDAGGQPLPDGLYRVRATQHFTDNKSVEVELELEVRPLRPFSGIVAIDFGTTASSVSYFTLDHRFACLDLDGGEGYLPTAIAYYLNDQGEVAYEIGHAARNRLADPGNRRVAYYDNLKLRLNQSRPALLPDNSERTWVEVAADYLRRLRERVEGHPAIAAQLDRACITQPARFDPRSSQALVAAYRAAGIEPRSYPVEGRLIDALSEAWPGAALALPIDDPGIRQWQIDAIGDPPYGEHPFGTYYLLAYDVGGGSTDLSLLAIEIQQGGQMKVTELASEGTTHFCGNAISTKFFAHSWPSCETWLRRHAYDPRQFPLRLPWDPIRPGDALAQTNGRSFAEALVFPMQWAGNTAYGRLIGELRGPKVWLDADAETLNRLAERFEDFWADMEQSVAATASMTLVDTLGNPVEVPIGREGVRLDFAAFARDFIDAFSPHLHRILDQMLQQLPDADTAPEGKGNGVFCLLSGRGALFPLIPTMVLAHAQRIEQKAAKVKSITVHRVSATRTKSYVSGGACHIDRFLLGAASVRFVPLPLERFGVLKGRDRNNRPVFLPLTTGYPEPEDGWIVAPYPLSPGPSVFRLEFYLALELGETLADGATAVGWLEPRTDLSVEQAGLAQLAILAIDETRVRVTLLIPPDGPGPAGEPSPETWQSRYDAVLHLHSARP